ncbi:YndJ family protein [Lysinibacillus piscis]|uniref:Membrane protein n=1 Tax=Lysinibacillus piscis TaxID=2518931 RepID=A0ABQ5NKJ3_9BACI|nr:YndJ family protein [Lysinibacillus sp. KH24]GLC88890.1 membrane protein [Lysinibacillus sp. KH24]
MLVNLRHNLANPLVLVGMMFFILCYLFSPQPDYLLLLTMAQLVFVPAMVKMIVDLQTVGKIVLVIMMGTVTLLHWFSAGWLADLLAIMYVFYTVFIAWQGVKRFLQRGFTDIAEIMIDIGLLYIFMGGLWFFAYTAQIDTGFSPLITWLTAIHFHYSACILIISVGLFGRIHKSKGYTMVAVILLAGPILTALGITFSKVLEVVSVVLYIVAIYILFALTIKSKLPVIQGVLLRISYGSLCVTILWSLLYAFGYVTIPRMLQFHGVMNGLLFAGIGVLAWAMAVPPTKQQTVQFPVSQIRGKLRTQQEPHAGLVDSLQDFVNTTEVPPAIVHFYEHTTQYRLLASVQWRGWFKPFALVYQGISRIIQQLNLPFSSKQIEMTGKIVKVSAQEDGRVAPRAWIRTIGRQTVFTAIYSQHTTKETTYMNIALPLPFSTMVGVLYVEAKNGQLHLTSEQDGDAGIYLAIGRFVCKLPLQEHFIITVKDTSALTASHQMRLFGLPFLRIEYVIEPTNL